MRLLVIIIEDVKWLAPIIRVIRELCFEFLKQTYGLSLGHLFQFYRFLPAKIATIIKREEEKKIKLNEKS